MDFAGSRQCEEPTFVIGAGTLVDGTIGGIRRDAALEVVGGRISRIVSAAEAARRGGDVHPSDILVPGYIDIHCHGAGGFAYDDGMEHAATIHEHHRSHGTTRAVLSFVTAPLAELEESLRAGVAAMAENPWILGLHPEGPFLCHEHKGAHEESLLIAPTTEAIERVFAAGGQAIAQITIAPELANGLEAVRFFAERGVRVAVGHTNATFEIAEAAFAAGARLLTHTFNAMPGIHHRNPGPIIAALRRDDVWLEVIHDTIHVHPAVVRSIFTEVPERAVLITDAMSATCRPDGEYVLGKLDVIVKDGAARLAQGGNLAGSTLTMDKAVAHTVRDAGVELSVAVAAATSHPAQAIGRGAEFGRLAAGYPADFLVLDGETLLPKRVFCAGVEYPAASAEQTARA